MSLHLSKCHIVGNHMSRLICWSDFGMLSLLGKHWSDYFVWLTLEAVFIYLTPVKTQLLQYNLTRDLMLLYHSNKLKA